MQIHASKKMILKADRHRIIFFMFHARFCINSEFPVNN